MFTRRMAVKAMRYRWERDILAGLAFVAILGLYVWLTCRYW